MNHAQGPIGYQISGAGNIGASLAHSEPKAGPARDVSEIERELNRLAADVDHLHRVIGSLTERLAPVIVPVPVGNGASSSEPAASSPVGSAIQSARYVVDGASQRISGLLASLAI